MDKARVKELLREPTWKEMTEINRRTVELNDFLSRINANKKAIGEMLQRRLDAQHDKGAGTDDTQA